MSISFLLLCVMAILRPAGYKKRKAWTGFIYIVMWKQNYTIPCAIVKDPRGDIACRICISSLLCNGLCKFMFRNALEIIHIRENEYWCSYVHMIAPAFCSGDQGTVYQYGEIPKPCVFVRIPRGFSQIGGGKGREGVETSHNWSGARQQWML